MALLFGRANPFVHDGRGHHEEHLCKIILNLDPWFGSKWRKKIFLI